MIKKFLYPVMFLICCPALLFAQSVKDGWKQFYNNEWKKARETFKSASSGAGNHEAYLGLSFLDYYEEKTEDGKMLSRVERTYDGSNRTLTTTVLSERPGQQVPQHYRIRMEYE